MEEDEYLAHYGILRRSGRYPWGSGGNVEARSKSFLDWIKTMRAQGLTEAEIAKGVGMSTTDLRATNTIAKNAHKQAQIGFAQRLQDKGYSNVAIGERMGIPESTVRNLLKPGAAHRADVVTSTANMLKEEVDSKKFVDVGVHVENYLKISKERLNVAVAMLKEQGYEVHPVKVEQVGTGKQTEMKVLVPPGVTQKEAWMNRYNIKQIEKVSDDQGENWAPTKNHPPVAVNPSRVGVRYAEDGGKDADGVIYVRPGKEDLSLGGANYAQVRIQVGDGHYLKGMAMYKDDLPEGVDLLFNTNKHDTGDKFDAMKPLSDDPDLPFNAVVYPLIKDKNQETERVESAMNIVNEEGKWNEWSRSLSTQMLSKQAPSLAREQLRLTYEQRKQEYEEILALTNPTIKKKLLETFADSTDSAAVHLKAAAMPRQNWHAILPINSLSDTEVYAPNYRNGETVVLIRYPHGGKFEIPELKVNNKHAEARKLLGNAPDAIGINANVAAWLSGADFDGDTVLVIPNNAGKIQTENPLSQLMDFDPREAYPAYEGMKRMTPKRKQQEMGDVSNLITDMTIKGAPNKDIARAVRHSMVVIDAENHNLNYRQSAIDNGIRNLKERYQGGPRSGASTLISLAGSEERIPKRKLRPVKEGGPIDPKTGRKVYVPTGETRKARDGERVPKLEKVSKLVLTDDATSLSSGTRVEKVYAEHSNRLKAMANKARLQASRTPRLKYSPSAKTAYSKEVASLDSKLALALKNKPKERQAQIIANSVVSAKKQANPNLDGDSLKKIKYQALQEARTRMGAGKELVEITPNEWKAIQAGAISNNKLRKIIDNADIEKVKELATPRAKLLMTPAKTARAQQMLRSGHTRAEVASQLGVSLTTLDTATKGQ